MHTNLSKKKISTNYKEQKPDEWETLLKRSKYWIAMPAKAWALRLLNNSLARRQGARELTEPLTKEEIGNAKNHWIKRTPSNTSLNLKASGWELVNQNTNILAQLFKA